MPTTRPTIVPVATFNGSTGMKQTFGRVSKYGCVPLGYSLDGINPMARSAYDCALMLNVLAGYDPLDPCTVDLPVPDYTATLNGSVRGITLGLPIPYFFDQPALDAETKAAVLAAVESLRSAGAIVKEIEILRNPWCVEDRVQCGATGDIALPRRNPLPRYEAADVSLNVRESHSSIFPAR